MIEVFKAENPPIKCTIYILNLEPADANLEQLAAHITGRMPEYNLIVSENSVNIIHRDYRMYMVRSIISRNTPPILNTFYNRKDLNEYIKYSNQFYDKALLEIAITDWNSNIIEYKWFKKFIR